MNVLHLRQAAAIVNCEEAQTRVRRYVEQLAILVPRNAAQAHIVEDVTQGRHIVVEKRLEVLHIPPSEGIRDDVRYFGDGREAT